MRDEREEEHKRWTQKKAHAYIIKNRIVWFGFAAKRSAAVRTSEFKAGNFKSVWRANFHEFCFTFKIYGEPIGKFERAQDADDWKRLEQKKIANESKKGSLSILMKYIRHRDPAAAYFWFLNLLEFQRTSLKFVNGVLCIEKQREQTLRASLELKNAHFWFRTLKFKV